MTDRDTFLISEFWPDKIAQANKLGQKYTSKKGWHSLLDIAIAQSFGCYVHIQPNFTKSGKSGLIAWAEYNGFRVEGLTALFRKREAWNAAEWVVECEDLLDMKLAELTSG